MNDTHLDPSLTDAAGTPGADATELETLRRERDDAQDRLLRLQAEFDNYRKRMERERRELGDHVTVELLTEFLPVIDDMERALDAAAAASDASLASHREGLGLIQKQFLDLLRRRQVVPIDALGSDFDPNVHQAVGQDVSADHREGEVLEELRRGYRLGERLLRPSMVRVATRG
ncbi:MAG: nucleotide exchange factor GrpE [Acidobacteria bacterium]|nr:nucleotide exchange factor GrpE [Acidobacteriota bacterium]